MDFALSQDQESLVGLARQILEDHATPDRLKAIEEGSTGLDRELWTALSEAGLIGASLPTEHGGTGFGFFELCLVLEEIGRTVAPVPAWATLVLGALPIARFGNDTLRARWLPDVVKGQVLLSGALEEPDSDDPLLPSTLAEADGSDWRLSGAKLPVPIADCAERVLVSARTGDGRAGLFLVDPGAAGVHLDSIRLTTRQPSFRMTLEGARVAECLAHPDDAAAAASLAWTVERATTALCAMLVGVADRALRMTAEYTTGRKQFDRPIGSFQAVHQRAADAYIDVEAMRLTLWQAAFRLAREEPASNEVAVAKFWASEGGDRVTYAAQHLHGGIGVDLDYPVHRYYLWARQLGLALGSSASQIERLGDALASAPPAVG
ncbi:MAG: acyl-CoA dehydrogenase family protein [Myxococcota bacterium]